MAADPEAIEKKQGSEGDSRVDLKEPSGTVGEITQQVNGSAKVTSSIAVKVYEECKSCIRKVIYGAQ